MTIWWTPGAKWLKRTEKKKKIFSIFKERKKIENILDHHLSTRNSLEKVSK